MILQGFGLDINGKRIGAMRNFEITPVVQPNLKEGQTALVAVKIIKTSEGFDWLQYAKEGDFLENIVAILPDEVKGESK